MRVTVVGNSGSGKTTLARCLSARFGLPALDLDTVAWEPGKVAVPRDPGVAEAELEAFCGARARWVVEGCYASLAERTLRHGPLLVFLDPGPEACQDHCRRRPWEPHKYDSKEAQDTRLDLLLAWVREYYTREGDHSLAAHRALFDAYPGPKLRATAPVEEPLIEAVARSASSLAGGAP